MDLSFLLNYLLSQSGFARYIDENNIGAIGFSLGGYSVLALAGAEIDYDLPIRRQSLPILLSSG
jgi:predicted dienelactone hydrolase